MIVSFHPIIEADENIICAGREPGKEDLKAIRRADAVVLSQGCSEALYRMARQNCPHVFPKLDVRFEYPGKCGQIALFNKAGLACPSTACFASLAAFNASSWRPAFPMVVKLDWGGQGETVFKVSHARELAAVLEQVRSFETTGQFGFLIQQFIPSGGRALRVVVIGGQLSAYWRIQPSAEHFGTSIVDGARIDHDADPLLQQAATNDTRRFCEQSGLQLAGLDFIFADGEPDIASPQPLALEINYFFGREGLGGSDGFYRILEIEVDRWLAGLSLKRPSTNSGRGILSGQERTQ